MEHLKRNGKKVGQIMHILEREDREFEEAMTGQVVTTFSSTKGMNKMGSIKMFTGTGIIAQCTTRKKSKFRSSPPLISINFYGG